MSNRLPSEADVHAMASGIFDTEDDVNRWFRTRNVELGGESPNDVIATEQGRMAVYEALVRLEFGVYA